MPLSAPVVLVVDDEPTVLGLVTLVLQRARYTVFTAGDSRSALAYSENPDLPVDLLLTDVVMPGLDGPQLAQQFRQGSPATRVLFMTGHPTKAALERGLSGEDEILRKPFRPRELVLRVERALSRSRTAGAL